jgi:oxygen-independent coproporphyrinogen III oxidase
MWQFHPELLETPVPRYTSYPTAAEFHDGLGSAHMIEALDTIEPGTRVSLYLHIPFCEKICWYCGCNTGAANRSNRLDAYLDALREEIAMVAGRIGARTRISHIAFGGGSPNALSAKAFQTLVLDVRRSFNARDAVLSTELDPRGMNRDWADMLSELGASKVSLGVQTLAPHIQRAIGRIQSIELVEQVMEWLRDANIGSINFDLMYGLPGQTRADLRETLHSTIAMAPDRVALFGYAHVPQLIPRQRRIDVTVLPDSAQRFQQAELGHRSLVSSGYAAVGFDHFARPDDPLACAARMGTLRRNFQGFTDDPAEILIGIGDQQLSGPYSAEREEWRRLPDEDRRRLSSGCARHDANRRRSLSRGDHRKPALLGTRIDQHH